MIRRLLPLLIGSLIATGAAAQSPGGGLASLPDPGEPDNFNDMDMSWHEFIQEQCTPRAFLETGRPIVDCTYWMRTPVLLGGRRPPGAPPVYLRRARLDLYTVFGEGEDEDEWRVRITFDIGEGPNPTNPDPDADMRAGGSYAPAGEGVIINPGEMDLRIQFSLPWRGGPDTPILLNSHAAILPDYPVHSYLPDVLPEPATLHFQRDPLNFEPEKTIPDELREAARRHPTPRSDTAETDAIREIERLTGERWR